MDNQKKNAWAIFLIGIFWFAGGIFEDLFFGYIGDALRGLAVPLLDIETSLRWIIGYGPQVLLITYALYFIGPEFLFNRKDIENTRHDVSLLEAINYLVTRDWEDLNGLGELEPGIGLRITRLANAQKEILQRAGHGDLVIYGKPAGSSAANWIEIKKEYWSAHQMQIMAYFDDEPHGVQTEQIFPGVRSTPQYQELRTSKERVSEIWKPKTMLKKAWEAICRKEATTA